MNEDRHNAVRGLVTVLPLVWVQEQRKRWTAGDYIINDARELDLHNGFIWGRVAQGWNDPVATLELAQAAAQAEHDSRIMSAIIPAVQS